MLNSRNPIWTARATTSEPVEGPSEVDVTIETDEFLIFIEAKLGSIDQDDTNWIVILKDVGPDVSVHTARQGERSLPTNLPERELTRGWPKASRRATDPARSKPWRPWHYLTADKILPVVPGEVYEYKIEILSTANMFKAGHRICLDITCLDLVEGVCQETTVEYIPAHVCSSKTVLHKVYHNAQHPSHLLLPLIPNGGGSHSEMG